MGAATGDQGRGKSSVRADRTACALVIIDVLPDRGLWRVMLDGELLGIWRSPFFAAARELLALGYPATARLEMRHASGTVGLRGTVGEAARWSADEGQARFRPYVPYPGNGGKQP